MIKSEKEVKVPRLGKGRGVLGAEWHGCCNSGNRALILHHHTGVYIVGTEYDVSTVRSTVQGVNAIYDRKRTIKVGAGTVKVFKGRAAAVKAFHALNQKVLDFNVRERDNNRKYREAIASGDYATAAQFSW